MKSYSHKIGEHLKSARMESGRTQEQLAEAMETSVKTIRNWEQDQVHPSLDKLLKLCDLYQCDLDYLTGRVDCKKCKTHAKQAAHEYTGLSEDSIEMLHKWNCSQDHPYFFTQNKALPILNKLIEHEPYFIHDVLEQIDHYVNAYSEYREADARRDYPRLNELRKNMDVAAFHASNGLVRIMTDLGMQK